MKHIGTVVYGIKTPIIKHGDDLIDLVIQSIKKANIEGNFKIEDKDIICMTEAIVAKAEGNYATIRQISKSVKQRFHGDTVGILMPILSRNRFSPLLTAFKKAFPNLIIQLNYPCDEVGNPIVDQETFDESGINPYSDVLTVEQFKKVFPKTIHPFTGIDYLEYYQELGGKNCRIILSNNPKTILEYTKQVIVANVHNRKQTKKILSKESGITVCGLEDILTEPVDGSGFHQEYGLLGSNKATDDKVKLFPRDGQRIVEQIQKRIFDEFQKKVEVLVYGDGAFKDPVGGIWELADPVVTPFYTEGLKGAPSEVKLKYIADSLLEQNATNIEDTLKNLIHDKKQISQESSLGTTPRRYIDLLGSLADLVSGSGDKGTPVVYIKNYFGNYAD